MKKLFVSALVVLGFTSLVSAQTSGNVGANIAVTIKQALSITELGTLNFGTAYPGYTVTPVDPQSASPSSIPVFTIAGEANTPVSVTWSPSLNLVNGSNNVPFEPTVAGNSSNTQVGSSVLASGTANATLSGVGSGNFGNYYLWLGGNINSGTALPALPSGTYSGTFTVNVAY
ncbi:MAG: DUF4402 domain-containing protein [Candidatus Kryptoniota bacterium]